MTRALTAVTAIILGFASAHATLTAPGFALAGDSVATTALGVAAGWALIAGGLALRSDGRLLAAAGFAWLAAGLGTPGTSSAPLFTLGLMCAVAAPALTGHAMLVATEEGHIRATDRAAVVALYGSAALLGPLAALTFDPSAGGCAACPDNLLLVASGPDPTPVGLRLCAIAVAGVAALRLWRLARAPAARRVRAAPVVIPAIAYLALVAADLVHSWSRQSLGNDSVDQTLFACQAAALLLTGCGIAWRRLAARRRRGRVARLVLDVADTQRAGGMRDAFARLLGDPDLDLLYARPGGGWIDAAGRTTNPPAGKATTQLFRDGAAVALLCHRPGLLDDARLSAELERTARLGLDHERLQAELREQLEHLRRSRGHIVAAAEAERRQLERDLHDGAQQRLVALAFALGAARRHAAPDRAAALETAHAQVLEALAELRALAHGLYPVALSEAGLGAAVESLSDRRPGLHAVVPSERFPPPVEETAYFAVATLTDAASPLPVTLVAEREDGRLIVDIRAAQFPPTGLVDIEDRVGALGGSVLVDGGTSGPVHVHLELPCA